MPGTVAGLWEVHSKFGSLEWSKLLEDAIYYAENGFYITPYLSDMLVKYESKLSFYPETKNMVEMVFILVLLQKKYILKCN